MRSLGGRIVVAGSLLLWLVLAAVSCGPRDARAPASRSASTSTSTSTSGSRASCRARVRCFRAIIAHQRTALYDSRDAVAAPLRFLSLDRDPEVKARAAALLKDMQDSSRKIFGALKVLAGPETPAKPVACGAAQKKLRRAMSMLKAEQARLLRRFFDLLKRLSPVDHKGALELVRGTVSETRQIMKDTRKEILGLRECRAITRRP